MAKHKFMTQYTVTDEWSKKFATDNREDSMTQQADANDADLNVIWTRYQQTGQIPGVTMQPIYGDFSQIGDYRTALDMVEAAEEAFSTVPAHLRKKFNNDPAEFIAFATNPDNLAEMKQMGLAVPDPIEERPIRVEVVPTPPAKP